MGSGQEISAVLAHRLIRILANSQGHPNQANALPRSPLGRCEDPVAHFTQIFHLPFKAVIGPFLASNYRTIQGLYRGGYLHKVTVC